jgi:hypothetical protein
MTARKPRPVVWLVEAREKDTPHDPYEPWGGLQFSTRTEARAEAKRADEGWSEWKFRVSKYVRSE